MKQYLFNILLAGIAVIAPLQQAMVTVGVLIFADLILGVYAAYKNNIKIESRKLKNTVVKTLVYQLVIICAFISEKFLVDVIPLTKITLGFIAVVEFKSIAENMTKITGLPFFAFIKSIINRKINDIEDIKEEVKKDTPDKPKDGIWFP